MLLVVKYNKLTVSFSKLLLVNVDIDIDWKDNGKHM